MPPLMPTNLLFSPCITCVQCRGGVQYNGVFSTMTGYHDACVLSTMGDIMSIGGLS